MVRPGVVIASIALALSLLLLCTRDAAAGPTRKVTIESDPPGAHVYLNEKEDGVLCEATPCTIDAPIGETPLIVELENYAPSITMLEVTRGRSTLKQMIKLDPAAGGGINAKAIPGKTATIKLDDEDKGTAPLKIPTDAGPHHIAYYVDGKQVYEEYIEVQPSPDYYDLTPKLAAIPPGPPAEDHHPIETPPIEEVHTVAPAKPHARIVTASVLFDVGFRQFTYNHGTGSDNRSESEQAQLLAGPLVEIYPTALFAPGTLPGLALVARLEFGLNDQPVLGFAGAMPPTTFWQSIEVSLRQRWKIKDQGTIDASAGYVDDRLQFNGDTSELKLLPDADYRSVRIGTRGSLLLGSLEPYAAFENRIVISTGTLGTRYDHATANGIHAALGIAYSHGPVSAHLEGQLTRYGSTFTNNMVSSSNQADGSSDLVEVISVSAGYTY